MIAKLICFFRGHKRGQFKSLLRKPGTDQVIARMFICPRCDATWTRKGKA